MLLYIASLKFLIVKLLLFMPSSEGIPAALFKLSIKSDFVSKPSSGTSIIILSSASSFVKSIFFLAGGVIEPGGRFPFKLKRCRRQFHLVRLW